MILFQTEKKGSFIEVRSAGKTRRLYINGDLHSQLNLNRAFENGVFAALSAPLFTLKQLAKPKIALLGLGGGTVVHHARRILPKASIEVVELDKTIISIARRFFQIDRTGAKVTHQCARDWMIKNRRKFDAIIDDTFAIDRALPAKGDLLSAKNLDKLLGMVRPSGVLVLNTLLPDTRLKRLLKHKTAINSVIKLMESGCENRIYVIGKQQISREMLSDHISAMKAKNVKVKQVI